MARHRKSTWDEGDLIRRLCHALDIALLALEHLAPEGYRDPQRPEASIRPEKVIAETGLLLFGASVAREIPEVGARIERVAGRLAPHARSAKMRLSLALNSSLALDYGMAHVFLERLGYADSGFDALLGQCLAGQGSAGRERVPYRVLEQEWIASLSGKPAGRKSRGNGPFRDARGTILGRPMDIFGATDDDLYAFTHAVMYATGLERTPGALPRSRAVILAEAEVALARCLDGQDYDLAAEILLAWPLTGKRWSAAAAFGFSVLAEVEDRAGFLPTPSTRVSELKAREGSDRMLYLVATAYHTAYVMGLLCAAALQPGCAPPSALHSERAVAGAAQQMLFWLEDAGTVPHWREAFERLRPGQADALAGMLFHIVLQRKVAERDFGTLEKVLRLGDELGLAAGPAASQAAELLERVADCARGLGGVGVAA